VSHGRAASLLVKKQTFESTNDGVQRPANGPEFDAVEEAAA